MITHSKDGFYLGDSFWSGIEINDMKKYYKAFRPADFISSPSADELRKKIDRILNWLNAADGKHMRTVPPEILDPTFYRTSRTP